MSETSISVIIPTIGRRSLERALASIVWQLGPLDEIILVGDGPQKLARRISMAFPGISYYETEPTRCWGHAQRNLGMSVAKGSHLCFLDDDDIWLPHGRESIKNGLHEDPDKLLFFRMKHMKKTLWKTREIAYGNVSTQMYVFPNDPHKLAIWRPRPDTENGGGGDFLFALETAALWPPGSTVFIEDMVAQLFEHSIGSTG